MTEPAPPYRVLARKYRPQTFSALIGQDALVRTLSNAIQTGRIAHAFILTGVRGVGKTTTARLIAKALNCIGPDGNGGPTTSPCGACPHCVAIAEDRHVDVIEMDAASRTGIDDVRELIDGVRYAPVDARYKVYIVDEVHMLSRQAFNGLLKTLEEPPPHVKFVFATTEIRKVPVTVLSRCQRFDLRRVGLETLARHFQGIAEREAFEITDGAAAMVARAADGSVRDGLSLLDQAIAMSDGPVTEETVKEMLGLADRDGLFALLEAMLGGRPRDALEAIGDMHRRGVDPMLVMSDLLDLVHWLSVLKIAPETAAAGVAEAEATRGAAVAESMTVAALGRVWQMLLKGLGEVQAAPDPLAATEMVMIRIAFAGDLPTPGDLAAMIGTLPAATTPAGDAPRGDDAASLAAPVARQASPRGAPAALVSSDAPPDETTAPRQADAGPTAETEAACAMPESFAALVALFGERREAILHANLYNNAQLVDYAPGRLTIAFSPDPGPGMARNIGERLTEWTGRPWQVETVDGPGEPSLKDQATAAEAARLDRAASHPLVRAVMDTFPGTTIRAVRPLPGRDDGAPTEEEQR